MKAPRLNAEGLFSLMEDVFAKQYRGRELVIGNLFRGQS